LTGRVENRNYPNMSNSDIFASISNIHPGSGPAYFSNGLPGQMIAGVLGSGYRKNDQYNVYSMLSIEQELPFIKGLSVKGTVAYDPSFSFDKNWGTPVVS